MAPLREPQRAQFGPTSRAVENENNGDQNVNRNEFERQNKGRPGGLPLQSGIVTIHHVDSIMHRSYGQALRLVEPNQWHIDSNRAFSSRAFGRNDVDSRRLVYQNGLDRGFERDQGRGRGRLFGLALASARSDTERLPID